jgi:hypothetical protein
MTEQVGSKLLNDMFVALLDDVGALYGRAEDSGLERRSFVRAVFAMFEGVTYALKQFALDAREQPFSVAEVALLNEAAYGLDQKGHPVASQAHLPFLANLRFTFAAAAKLGGDFSLHVDGQGWQALQRALGVRHRLMHPKSLRDLQISDREVDETFTAFQWFVANVTMFLKSHAEALHHEGQVSLSSEQLARLASIESRYAPFLR